MESNDLIVLDSDNEDLSPKVVSRRVIDGDYILKKKNSKGSIQIMTRCLESCVAVCVRCVSFIKQR